MRAVTKFAAALAALMIGGAAMAGPVRGVEKHPLRTAPSTATPSTVEVVITGSDLLVAEMRAAEPTTVFNSQSEFQVMSWNNTDYDVATLIKPCVSPCSGGNLLPASLQGATITAVRIEITRKSGFFDVSNTFSLKQALPTDISAANVTWTNRTTGSPWNTGGAQGVGDAGAAMSTVTALASVPGETYTFASSAALVLWMQALASGTQTAPWLLLHTSPSRGSYNVFHGPTGTTPPKVIVTKVVP
jgi:hypothetical protein